MKEQITKLLDELADKNLTDGCVVLLEDGRKKVLCPYFQIEKIVRDNKRMKVKKGETYLVYGDGYCVSRKIERVLGHPILIGDVLASLNIVGGLIRAKDAPETRTSQPLDSLVFYWKRVGLTHSLQNIFDCEWISIKPMLSGGREMSKKLVPKDPSVRALAEFLLSLNLTESK